MPSVADITCPGCGSAVTPDASEGLCAACLLTGVLGRGDLGEAPPVADPATLQRCGDYEILGVLARGGMGVVFRARQAGLTREVALKMIAAADLAAPDDVRRFRLEAELIARLEHPHIIPVHSVGEHDGRPFFVMKLADGGTLAQRLEQGTAFADLREAAVLLTKVTRAVHFAHEHGVLHRDLKPANILLDGAGVPMVSDFGLARLAQHPAGSSRTAAAVGTPAYMAPEQAQGSDAVTMASDVYGLGAVLYHMLTGRAPFRGRSVLEILRRAETEEPENPRAINPRVDRDLATICLKCLEKTPARRYHSAAELAEDLERSLRGEPVQARPAPWHERCWKWMRRRPAMAALLGAGVAGTAVFAALLAEGHVILLKERNYAQQKEIEATKGKARAEQSERAMRLNVYAADMFLARRALDDGHLGVARQTLMRHVPQGGEEDLRGFEWYALDQLCRGEDQRADTGHTAAVLSVAWSPDGQFTASGGRDGKVFIRRAATGEAVKTLPDRKAESKIAELAFLAGLPRRSPDTGSLLAPVDGVSIEEMRMRARPSSLGEVNCVAWSPDGSLFATSGVGSYIRLWSVKDWSYLGFIPVKSCQQMAFSGDSRYLVFAMLGAGGSFGNGEVRIYDTATLTRTFTVTGVVAIFGIAPQAGRMVVNRGGDRVEVLRIPNGEPVSAMQFGESAYGLALSPDGRRLVAMHQHSGAIYNPEDGRAISGLTPQGERFRCIAVSADSQYLAAGSAGHSIQIFNTADGSPVRTMRGHNDEPLALSFSPDGTQLYSGGTDQTARLWSLTGGTAASADIPENGSLSAVSPDGSLVLAGGQDGVVRCRDHRGKLLGATPPGAVRKPLGFRAAGDRWATWQEAAGLLEWWTPDGQPAGKPLEFPEKGESFSAVCPATGWIAIVRGKAPVHVYDWETGMLVREVPVPPLKVLRLVFAPDGSSLVALSWPRTAVVFDSATGRWSQPRKLSSGTVGPIVVSPDSRLMASGGDDNLVTIADLRSGEVVTSLRGHMGEVQALAFSQDGKTLASAGADTVIRLWHVPTWRELGPLARGAVIPGLRFTSSGLIAEAYANSWRLLPGRAAEAEKKTAE